MKLLVKNKFVSTILGTFFAYFGIAFLLSLSNFSVNCKLLLFPLYCKYKPNLFYVHLF